MTIWRPIPGWPYEASDNGEIRRATKSRRSLEHNSTLPRRTTRMKRSELRRGKPKRKTAAQRRRDEERKAAEFARKYHSEERVIFVRFAMRCAVPGCDGRPENAHIDGEGMGRKGHYTRIVPLCRGHHRLRADSIHALGSVRAFNAHHGLNLERVAKSVDGVWEAKGPRWIAQAKADGSYEAMRRAA